ncbi:hypothetical protein L1987_32724 [Smallanthus sonchifolius]|uniref:Uncharacterized protein n=1 Tax=Smallanthus sonchifolius TaxID=185202 RepID=A0ACB9HNT2_9ASTR|nr:hypothetical protein L1987_32724 [Smallanthus sonchifolius]
MLNVIFTCFLHSSSRSQCIINIRCDLDYLDEDQSCTAILTIVDLAGAEREKRTGNQVQIIIAFSYVISHNKGKKRMALILTAKPGEEDYQDTSYLLRQASPFMNIKFESIEEQPLGNKRRTQTLPKVEQAKRMKLNSNEVCMDDETKGVILHEPHKEELVAEPDKEVETNGSSFQFPVNINIKENKNKSIKESITDPAKKAREYQILLNFSRAVWKVLKEYKNKLEASENEADALRHDLMKASCSCGKVLMAEEKLNGQISSSHSIKMECIKKQIVTDTVATSVPLLPDCSNTVNLENQVDAQVSCSKHCEEHVDTRVVSSINDTSSVEVASTSLNIQNFEEQSNEDTSSVEVASTSLNVQNFEEQSNEKNAPCEYVVFDKEDLMELGDTEFGSDIAGYDTLESGVSDFELQLHGDEVPFLTKGDQRKHEEEKANLSESEGFQNRDKLDDTVTIDHEINSVEVKLKSSALEKFKEQSKEKVDVSSAYVALDKQEFKEFEERETSVEITGCDNLESADCDSEHVHGEKDSSFVMGDQWQHEEDSNAQFQSLNSSESQCFAKQNILDDSGISFAEVVSISGGLKMLEDQSKEIVEVSTPNLVCDKQELKEVEERDANEEVTDEVSSFLEVVQPEQEEKEVNAPISSSDVDGSKSARNTQFIDSTVRN